MSDSNSENSGIKRWFRFDRRMIPAKIAYLMVYGAVGTILPFINIFLVSIGCTEREAGIINGVTFGFGTILPPLSGLMMDSIRNKRAFTISMLLTDAISIFSMPFVAAYINPLNITKKLENSHMIGYSEHDLRREEFTNSLFWSMLTLLAITRAAKLSLLSFLDAAVTDSIKHTGSGESFSQQVMGMPLGIGVASFIASVVAQTFHSVTMSRYSAVLFCSLPFNLAAIPFIFAVYNNTSWYDTKLFTNSKKDDDSEHDESPKEGDNKSAIKDDTKQQTVTECKTDEQPTKISVLRNTVFQPQMMLLLSSVFVIGWLRVTFDSYLFLIMAQQMHSSQVAMGVVAVVSGVAQAVFFFFAQMMIDRLGVFICLELSVTAWCVLLFVTSCIYNSWLNAIPVLLQGLGLSVAYASMTHYLSNNSPQVIYTTLFTLNQCLWLPAGGLVANVIGGFVSSSSVQVLYRAASLVAMLWLIFMMMFLHIGPVLSDLYRQSQQKYKDYRQVQLQETQS